MSVSLVWLPALLAIVFLVCSIWSHWPRGEWRAFLRDARTRRRVQERARQRLAIAAWREAHPLFPRHLVTGAMIVVLAFAIMALWR